MGNGALPNGPSYRAYPRLSTFATNRCHRRLQRFGGTADVHSGSIAPQAATRLRLEALRPRISRRYAYRRLKLWQSHRAFPPLRPVWQFSGEVRSRASASGRWNPNASESRCSHRRNCNRISGATGWAAATLPNGVRIFVTMIGRCQWITGSTAPEDGGQSEVGILAPSKQFDCIAVITCRLDFQPQFADAENCQKPGEIFAKCAGD